MSVCEAIDLLLKKDSPVFSEGAPEPKVKKMGSNKASIKKLDPNLICAFLTITMSKVVKFIKKEQHPLDRTRVREIDKLDF